MFRALAAAVLFAALSFDAVGATPVSVRASGELGTVGAPLQSLFAPGDSFTFTYTFDPEAVDFREAALTGDYLYALTAVHVSVGPFEFEIPAGSIVISNGQAAGDYDAYIAQTPAANNYVHPVTGYTQFLTFNQLGATTAGLVAFASSIELVDWTQSAYDTDALPPGAPDLTAFSQRRFAVRFAEELITGGARGVHEIAGTVTSITVVPEPTTWTLLIVGMLTICAVRPSVRR